MRYRLAIALALIDQHICPCPGCKGQLAPSEYPSWRRCQECRCSWRTEMHGARRYAARVSGHPCLVATAEEAPHPADASPARHGGRGDAETAGLDREPLARPHDARRLRASAEPTAAEAREVAR